MLFFWLTVVLWCIWVWDPLLKIVGIVTWSAKVEFCSFFLSGLKSTELLADFERCEARGPMSGDFILLSQLSNEEHLFQDWRTQLGWKYPLFWIDKLQMSFSWNRVCLAKQNIFFECSIKNPVKYTVINSYALLIVVDHLLESLWFFGP